MASPFLQKPWMRKYRNLQGTAISSAMPAVIWWEHVFVYSFSGKGHLRQTSVKVSAQMRERTLRIAVFPFSNKPTVHWSFQHSVLEQDYGNRHKSS